MYSGGKAILWWIGQGVSQSKEVVGVVLLSGGQRGGGGIGWDSGIGEGESVGIRVGGRGGRGGRGRAIDFPFSRT